MGLLRRIFSRRPGAAQVEAAVLPGSEDVALRYPGEGVPRIISAATASAIADAVNLRRRILAAEQHKAPDGAGA
ncbi:MAG: hypothetical protein L6Q74_04940 [Sphaerotilus natans subsp. sulfidivorans]|uniref:hypothetical protein n=1 Tax=Sphaerotilus sulfidivorans TaxID=639200 RepID=UPI0023567D1A|nr:hypothetical protein [Sphaerotilus sulfidivorans]MCK6401245.1 hypothetical protein [Sphaerotilus sulfidivorans]